MWQTTALSLAAVAALVPGALLPYRRRADRPDRVFWLLLAVALSGTAAVALIELRGAWNASFSSAIWLSIATSMLLFILLAAFRPHAWRLAPLIMPYLLLLGVMGAIWSHADGVQGGEGGLDIWLKLHIGFSLLTYALTTLAAVAGAAVFLQDRALKAKQSNQIAGLLPALADAERLEVSLLRWAVAVMLAGVLTGMAEQYLITGQLLVFDHKVLFSFLAFGVLLLLLVFHSATGLRGRLAVRLALLAYLLLTIAFLGVKFVADVLSG